MKETGWKCSIEVPLRIKGEQNTSSHWRAKAKAHATQKQIMGSMLLYWESANKMKFPQYTPLKIKMTRLGKREMDDDNLIYSLKWIRDAVADYIWPYRSRSTRDNHELVKWVYGQEKGQQYALRIEIEEDVEKT